MVACQPRAIQGGRTGRLRCRGSSRDSILCFDRLPGLLTLQLAGAKVSKSNFGPKQPKFHRYFKGVFQNGNMEVRILPGQPGSLARGDFTLSTSELPADGGLLQLAVGLRTPKLAAEGAKSPIVSGRQLKYSRFRETGAGDRVRSALRGRVGKIKDVRYRLPKLALPEFCVEAGSTTLLCSASATYN
jgi:hypothetical protein